MKRRLIPLAASTTTYSSKTGRAAILPDPANAGKSRCHVHVKSRPGRARAQSTAAKRLTRPVGLCWPALQISTAR